MSVDVWNSNVISSFTGLIIIHDPHFIHTFAVETSWWEWSSTSMLYIHWTRIQFQTVHLSSCIKPVYLESFCVAWLGSCILIDRETPLARTCLGQMSIVSHDSDVSTCTIIFSLMRTQDWVETSELWLTIDICPKTVRASGVSLSIKKPLYHCSYSAHLQTLIIPTMSPELCKNTLFIHYRQY